jgi:homoserine dehydrogenase
MTKPTDAPIAPRRPLRLAIAGLGTVGTGVLKLLDENAELIARRAGRPIIVTAISARDRHKDRGVDLSRYRWEDDMDDLATLGDVDCVVELIGGSDGPALTLARNTIARGKAFVTANKAMIAHHGMDLARAADASDTPLKFEAAVAGGIPVIKALREGASANRIQRVYGILNGTCNFILTKMEMEGRDFADVLAEAQAKGFAEADPSFDIDGVDAAHKLSILGAMCFSTPLAFDAVGVTGIRAITAADIRETEALGYRIRLIGMAEQTASGLYQSVAPCLVPAEHPLAYVPGALNAVVAEGNFVGRLFLEGAGAGDGPTASAVVADIIDVARDEYGPAFGSPVDGLETLGRADSGAAVGKHYLRLTVADRTGVLAEIATAMAGAGVSIESFIQRGSQDGAALIVMVTHECAARDVDAAMAALAGSPNLIAAPLRMPILAL